MIQQSTRLLPKKTTFAIILSVGVLIVANLFMSNFLATTGEKVRAYGTRKQNLLRQNSELHQQIVKQKTLSSVETRAHALGLSKIEQTLSLTSQLPIAMSNP